MFSFFKRKKASKDDVAEENRVAVDPQPLQVETDTAATQPSPASSIESATISSAEPNKSVAAAQTPVAPASATALPVAGQVSPDVNRQALAKLENLDSTDDIFTEISRTESLSPAADTLEALTALPEPPATTTTPEPAAPIAGVPSGMIASSEPAPESQPKGSWLSRLRKGLSRTGQSIGGIFVGVTVDEDLFEELETALIMSDAGVEATDKLLTALRARVRKEKLNDGAQVRAALKEVLAEHLRPLEKNFDLKRTAPLVVMIAGVNGAGKTTSIGKLANAFQAQGASVLLAAGDTFRAAAREQLVEWGARNNVAVIAQEGGDPAAVAFDAVNAGKARGMGVVMVDTAGRLPTQLHLMEELKKIKRVTAKADGDAPHEVLLVVDGNTGQNALSQIKAFDAAIGLTGLVVTKLDGTAKGARSPP